MWPPALPPLVPRCTPLLASSPLSYLENRAGPRRCCQLRAPRHPQHQRPGPSRPRRCPTHLRALRPRHRNRLHVRPATSLHSRSLVLARHARPGCPDAEMRSPYPERCPHPQRDHPGPPSHCRLRNSHSDQREGAEPPWHWLQQRPWSGPPTGEVACDEQAFGALVKPGLANKLGACDLNTSVGAPVLRDCRAHSRRQVPAESPKCSYGELIPVAIYGICLSLGYERFVMQ